MWRFRVECHARAYMSNSDMPIPETTVKRIVAMGINVAEIFFIVFIAVQFCVFMYKSF